MIQLNRLSGEEFLLNADLIKYVEARPDTFVTLTTGDRIVVQQLPEEVLRKALDYQQRKRLIPEPQPAPEPRPAAEESPNPDKQPC